MSNAKALTTHVHMIGCVMIIVFMIKWMSIFHHFYQARYVSPKVHLGMYFLNFSKSLFAK